MLAALPGAIERGDQEQTREADPRDADLAERNIQALRDEIVALGPYAFRELSFETAVRSACPSGGGVSAWTSRIDIEQIELSPDLSGPLFQIAQEAVTNAGRHAAASTVRVALAERDGVLSSCGSRTTATASATSPRR